MYRCLLIAALWLLGECIVAAEPPRSDSKSPPTTGNAEIRGKAGSSEIVITTTEIITSNIV